MPLSSARRARETGLLRRLPLLLAMVAIALQTLVLAPHVHAIGAASEAAASAAADRDHAASGLAACSVCRIAASARAFTGARETPTPVVEGADLRAPQIADLSVRLTPAPAWRSRAPPFSLS